MTSITIQEVIQSKLCTRCGTCASTCPKGAIEFSKPWNGNLPQITQTSCESCSAPCLDACSGKSVPFNELNKFLFKSENTNFFMGHVLDAQIGYALDPEIRSKAASGGIITQTLIALLDQKKIDGAILVRMSKTNPAIAEPYIASTPSEIQESAQSKYSIVPLNSILKISSQFKGSLAYVGLPCQIHSLRMLQMQNSALTKNIDLVIGSYCGNTLVLESVKMFLQQNGVRDFSQIQSLEYRAGEWPGFMRVVLKNQQEIKLKKFYANYLIPFFMMDRCFTCVDLTNELADISCGDAWSPVYEDRGKGWSLVLARTLKGQSVLESLSKTHLHLQSTTIEDAQTMHAHMLDFKKRGAFIRMSWLKKMGRKIPDYGFEPSSIPNSRKRFEFFLCLIFVICQNPLSLKILPFIPAGFFGKFFESFRTFWKKKTLKTKRAGLFETKYQRVNS